MIFDVLKDLKEKGGGVYIVRARGDALEIIPRGTNEQVYHFDISDNVVRVRESFDVSKTATRVKVIGQGKEEGKQHVDAVIDGRTDLGIRQRIYQRSNKESVEDAEKAAKKILEEQGVERKTSLETVDIPFIRKGDKIRLRNSLGEAYFFVKSIRHNAATQKMTLELDYDVEGNKDSGYEIAASSETRDE